MAKPPILKPREVVALLTTLVSRASASAARTCSFATPTAARPRCRTTVPDHGGRDISPTLLRKIARDIGMTTEEVVEGRR